MMQEDLRTAIAKLPEAQREVIILRFASGLSVSDTAKALGKRENNTKVLQHKGLLRLQVLMSSKYPEILKSNNRNFQYQKPTVNYIQNGQFPIETKGENLPKKTVNEWITQDYQNALVVASNVLTRIQMKDFESYVKGALLQGKSAKEIANESGRVLTTFEDVLQRAKVRLSNRLNLDLGNGKAGHSLK